VGLYNKKTHLHSQKKSSAIPHHLLDRTIFLLYSIPVQPGEIMPIHTTYTKARANMAKMMDKVIRDRDVVVIERRGSEDVALISATELASLTETAYLLRSPKNAERLLSALNRALKNEGHPMSPDALRKEIGIDAETP
jgi:antitoxin YefM